MPTPPPRPGAYESDSYWLLTGPLMFSTALFLHQAIPFAALQD